MAKQLTKEEVQTIIDNGKKRGISGGTTIEGLVSRGYGVAGVDSREVTESVEKREAEKVAQMPEERGLVDKLSVVAPFLNPADTFGDIKETGQGVFSQVKQFGQDIAGITADTDLSLSEKVRGAGASMFRRGAGVVGEVFKGGAKLMTTPEGEEVAKEGIEKVVGEVLETDTAQKIKNDYDNLSPDVKREVDNALGFGEGLGTIWGLKGAGGLNKAGINKIDDVLSKYLKKMDGTVSGLDDVAKAGAKDVGAIKGEVAPVIKEVGLVDDAFKLNKDDFVGGVVPATARTTAEATAPDLTLREKSIGLQIDDKAQILGKTDKMQEYIDVVKTRNVTKDAPSVMEYGGDQVRKAGDIMEQNLQAVGSDIGSARTKYASIQAPVDKVKSIENVFVEQLNGLGLKLDGLGNVVRKPGSIRKYGSNSDINALQEIYDEFRLVKQSPTLTNLIDYRNFVQKNIDFSKRAGEVSNSLDGPARILRREIKDVADGVVGPTEAGRLTEYSTYMQGLDEIRSFTDRKAGGEYLLRVLESGRGGEARRVVATIKKHTGIDLQDDATMMKLVTDSLANESQKTLFRSQITGAGIDASRILSGDPTAILSKVGGFITDKVTDAEKILIRATKGGGGGVLDDLIGGVEDAVSKKKANR